MGPAGIGMGAYGYPAYVPEITAAGQLTSLNVVDWNPDGSDDVAFQDTSLIEVELVPS